MTVLLFDVFLSLNMELILNFIVCERQWTLSLTGVVMWSKGHS